MSHQLIYLTVGALAVVTAGVPAWAHYAPRSYWYCLAFPARVVRVYLTWAHVADSCGLAVKRRRWRLTLDAIPVAGSIARTTVTYTHRRRLHRIEVPFPPGLGLLRPGPLGWSVRVRMRKGQVPADYIRAAERLAHAWRVHAVRVTASRPGRLWLLAVRTDPLVQVAVPAEPGELLTVSVGMLETGQPWVIDFRTVPHWLNAGATQSGKSNLANAVIKGLAPQPVALVGFDLKGGVEFTPYAARLSALAVTRAECADLLDDLVRLLGDRMRLCRAHGARNIWRLPGNIRPVPVVVLVDEVAELFLMADRAEKDQVSRNAIGLLRVAQLGRAFGVYLIVCGQRLAADLGPGVTALRSQLSGRICHRVNDPETATMTLGDLDPDALAAARAIPASLPGVAIVAGVDGTWHCARSVLVTEDDAEQAAVTYSFLTPGWAELSRPGPVPVVPPARRGRPRHPSRPRPRKEARAMAVRQRAAQVLDFAPVLILAAIAGSGSFVHIRDTAAQHGQRGPMSWAIAVCIDLTCVMAARERQRDKRTGRACGPVNWPTVVLTFGVLASLAANLEQAQPDSWGRITAAVPAAAFLIAVSMLERRTSPRARTEAGVAAAAPVPASQARTSVPAADHPAIGPASAGQPAPALLDFAVRVAAEHQAANGQPITRHQLRARLGVSNQLASQLLRQIRTEGGIDD
jgi:hypothetical protein